MVPISSVAEYVITEPCCEIVRFPGRFDIDANCLTSPSVVLEKWVRWPMISSSPEIPDSDIVRKSVSWS